MVRTKVLAAVSAAAATAVAAVALPAGSATATVRPAAYRVAVSNAGFEARPAWRSSTTHAVVTRSRTPHGGRYSGLLYARSAGSASMTPTRALVTRTVAGTTYTISVWTASNGRGSVPVAVQLVEVHAGKVVRSATTRATAGTSYRKLTTALTARYSGSSVTVRIGASLKRKQAVRVDDLYLTARAPAKKPAPKPTTTSPSPTPTTTTTTTAPAPTTSTTTTTTTTAPATTTTTTSATTTAAPVTSTTQATSTTLPATAFGASAQLSGDTYPQAVARSDAKFGHLDTLRYFSPGLPPAWSTITAVGQRDLVVSFKADPASVIRGESDSYLRNWFATAPTDRKVWWTYYHEPEDDIAAGRFTAAQFREAFRHVAGLADAVGRPDLKATLILMGYTANPNSGRVWTDYYPGADVVDVMAWDIYNHAAAMGTSYSPPDTVFGKAVALTAAAGKPFAIAETGSVLLPGDTGSGRAAWLQASATYLKTAHAQFVTYFDNTVTGGDYALKDTPSIDVWAAQM